MVNCKVPPPIASTLDGTVMEDVTLRVQEKDPVAERQSRAICAICGAIEYENGTFDDAREGKDTLNRDLNVKAKPFLLGTEPVDTKLVNILGKDVVIPADCPLNEEQLEGIHSSCNKAPGGLMLIQGPPSTGKSYLISWLTVVLEEMWIDVQSRPKHQGPTLAPSNTGS